VDIIFAVFLTALFHAVEGHFLILHTLLRSVDHSTLPRKTLCLIEFKAMTIWSIPMLFTMAWFVALRIALCPAFRAFKANAISGVHGANRTRTFLTLLFNHAVGAAGR
jgi:hypothetical protein